jgi:hypothetical protein
MDSMIISVLSIEAAQSTSRATAKPTTTSIAPWRCSAKLGPPAWGRFFERAYSPHAVGALRAGAPGSALAQQKAMPVIAFLNSGAADARASIEAKMTRRLIWPPDGYSFS